MNTNRVGPTIKAKFGPVSMQETMPTISDGEIILTACAMIRSYGANACSESSGRQQAFDIAGDKIGAEVWGRVACHIDEILDSTNME